MGATLVARALVAGGTTWHVDASGVPPGTGTLQDPFTTIAAALTASLCDDDVILVAAGTYRENLTLPPVQPDFISLRSSDGPDGAGLYVPEFQFPIVERCIIAENEIGLWIV